jgi:excisionase family DNA binding protein
LSVWATVADIAHYLNVSVSTIYNLARAGKIPASKIGGQWRFNMMEIEAWARSQRGEPDGRERR